MKRTKILPFLFLITLSFHLVSCNTEGNSNKPDEANPSAVFDLHHGKLINNPRTFTLKEFDNPNFRISRERNIYQEGTDFKIDEVNALFTYDINEDGYRDLFITCTMDNDTYLDYSYIYDLKNNKRIFYAIDSVVGKNNDYHFTLKENKLMLIKERCDKAGYGTDVFSKGYVKYDKDKGVYIEWNNMYGLYDCNASFSSPDNTDTSIGKNKEEVKVVTAKTYTIYSFAFNHETYNEAFGKYDNFSNVFSFINCNGFDDSLKVFKQENSEIQHRVFFYFTKSGTADYEMQFSGTSQKYRFVVEEEQPQTIADVLDIAGLNKEPKQINYDENGIDYNYRYDGTRKVNDDYNAVDLKPVLDAKVCEVSENTLLIDVNMLHGRITYIYDDNLKPYIDIYRGGFVKINNKYYAMFYDFNYEGTRYTYGEPRGFAVGYNSVKIKDKQNPNGIMFENLDSIRFTAETDTSGGKYPNLQYRYSFVVSGITFYVYDAKCVVSFYGTNNGSGTGAHIYSLTSNYDFSSLF